MTAYEELLEEMCDPGIVPIWLAISSECIKIEDDLTEEFVLSTGYLPTSRDVIRIEDFCKEYWEKYWDEEVFILIN